MFSKRWQTVTLVSTTIFFSIFFSLISIVRHYNFNSNTSDLGIFNQTLYQYAHFSSGPNTIREVPHLLGDHFEITFIAFAPFYYLFGSYTLLIFQILAVLGAGLGIFYLSKKNTDSFYFSWSAMVIFFLSFGTISAVNYDYHNNVLGIAFLPWILLALQNNNKKLYGFGCNEYG